MDLSTVDEGLQYIRTADNATTLPEQQKLETVSADHASGFSSNYRATMAEAAVLAVINVLRFMLME